MSPDLSQASRLITLLADAHGSVHETFQTFDDTDAKRAALAKVMVGSFDDYAARLQTLNEQGAGCFITVNATDGGGRHASNVSHIRSLFADLDGAPLAPVLACGVDSSAEPADRIGAASAYLQAEGYTPGVVFLNPQDWFAIASERTLQNEYVAAGWTAPASPTIYGLTAIATPSIAIGTALVMDPAVAVVGLRQSPTVEMSREHNGAFTKNLVTVLAELRLALLVMDAGGMASVSLA